MLSKNSSALIVLKEAGKRGISVHFNPYSSPTREATVDEVEYRRRLEASGPFTSKLEELPLRLYMPECAAKNKVRGLSEGP